MKTKSQILERMALYRVPGGGIGSWLTERTCDDVFNRLGTLDNEPLPGVQLNQLLVLAHEAPVSDGFFRYYWLNASNQHPYDVSALPGFKSSWQRVDAIQSLDHLAWGLHRLYIDALLYFGNVRTAFRTLRDLSYTDLQNFFSGKRLDTEAIKRRGPPLPLRTISVDKRYLISEMACKSYGENPQHTSDLRLALTQAYNAHIAAGGGEIAIQDLLERHLPADFKGRKESLLFSSSDILTQIVTSETELHQHYNYIARRFSEARRDALENTRYYLSMISDLDVYVATSMRTREHFLKMAHVCESVFSDKRLNSMNLRYFDPTLSAASGHEDKGLIECLMVKCAKALVYCGGEKESYGKDAEAAMALSLGRPVIFYCEQRAQFYREVHPLTRLIQFDTGVAVGAMVTDSLDEVAELLYRTLENKMVYRLEKSTTGSLRLMDDVTGSVIRLQTSDELLTETFWNHYHRDPSKQSKVFSTSAEASSVPENSDANLQNEQVELPLGDTADLLPLAARATRQEDPEPKEQSKPPPGIVARPTTEPFPLSRTEVFDGISKLKRAQSTGEKRYSVFSKWLDNEKVNILEGVKLLRFVEATLESRGARSTFVYKHSDLSRWYREMSAGEVVGS